MPYMFEADFEKTREAIVYIAERCPGITFYYVLKIMYFAERSHCERYGRLIFGNQISAKFEKGPVPLEAYRLIDSVRYGFDEAEEVGFSVNGIEVKAVRAAVVEIFSESELECIDNHLSLRKMRFGKLKDLSHDDAYKATQAEEGGDMIMTIDTFTRGLENRETILRHFEDPFPG